MKVITAVKKYLKTEKEIFIQNKESFHVVRKDKDFYLEFGERIAYSRVKKIDEEESPDAVTIYF